MATDLVQARIDSDLKDSVSRILEENGLDIPTAIRMYFAKIERVGGIPFDVRLADARTLPSTTVLAPSDFDRLLVALREPFPTEARELLDRTFE